MKVKKLSLLKRILVLFCCTVFLLSSIFSSYSMTVYAADDYDIIDAAQDVLNICIVIGGLIFAPATDGLSVLVTTQNILGLRDSIEGLRDYITDNGDGTYTIDPAFVQAVMDAAEQLEDQGFTDSHVTAQGMGNLYTYKWTVSESFMYNHPYKNVPESHHYTYTYSAENTSRVAGFKEIKTSIDSNGRTNTAHFWYVYMFHSSYTKLLLGGRGNYVGSIDGNTTSGGISTSGFNSLLFYDGSQKSDKYNGSQSFGGNFPIFSSNDALETYLKTGKGYRDAENYRPTPIVRRHSSYTPIYSGGPVTVNRTVIENISQKITEVDADTSLTDDQKIEKLQEYIRTGGTDDGNGDGDASGGTGDKDYDDNKDLPAGTELTDTNSWLKKIYLKLCQIADDFKSFFIFEDAPGINMKYITSLFERMLAQLKDINGDLDDIKGQLADMSEQEFEEKSDSFLGDVMDAFSEISEVVKTKFPFSIPNDLRIFLSKIAPSPSGDGELQQYSVYTSGISLYSGDHGGGGASRPGSPFVGVEHGGGGASGEPAEMREAPVFRLPIVIERYGIEEYIIIDMAPFDPLSRFSRSFFTVTFIVCLFNLTFKVIGMWGDLIG